MVHGHYFKKQRAPTAAEWRRITRAVKRLLRQLQGTVSLLVVLIRTSHYGR